MANIFYDPGAQRAAKVRELFGGIATRYDLMNDVQSLGFHRVWKRRLVRLANPQAGQRALDVCCGTGDIAFSLADAGMEVTGLDFSEPMLDVARKKKHPSNRNLPQFIQGDAQHIPFPDGSFDLVTVGYGLRNLASLEAGLAELQRVAKPGGRILALDFGKPDNVLWREIYFGYLRFFIPLLGAVFCRNPAAYAYILESLKHYPAQRGVAERMTALGLKNVQILNLFGGVMSINLAEKAR